MAVVVRREVRKRGFFGWVFLLLFLSFNFLMAAWLLAYWSDLANMTASGDAEKTGQAIGGALGSGFLLILWCLGSVILGLLAILTRGSKRIIEERS